MNCTGCGKGIHGGFWYTAFRKYVQWCLGCTGPAMDFSGTYRTVIRLYEEG